MKRLIFALIIMLSMAGFTQAWEETGWHTPAPYLSDSGETFAYDPANDYWESTASIKISGSPTLVDLDNDAVIRWYDDSDNDSLIVGLRVNNTLYSGVVAIMQKEDIGEPKRIPIDKYADIHFRVHSSDETADDYMEFFHNQAGAFIQSDTGSSINIMAGTGIVQFGQAGVANIGCAMKFTDSIDQFGFFINEDAGSQVIFADNSYKYRDFDHAIDSNSVAVFIHSNYDPDTDNTQYLGLKHDRTNSVITSGKGNIELEPNSGIVSINQILLIDTFSSSDPAEPSANNAIIWVSDGTGKGDDGDVMIAVNVDGTTKTATLFNHSEGDAW